jgi:hypothetical protein
MRECGADSCEAECMRAARVLVVDPDIAALIRLHLESAHY